MQKMPFLFASFFIFQFSVYGAFAAAQASPETPLRPITGTQREAAVIALCQPILDGRVPVNSRNLLALCQAFDVLQHNVGLMRDFETKYDTAIDLILSEARNTGVVR